MPSTSVTFAWKRSRNVRARASIGRVGPSFIKSKEGHVFIHNLEGAMEKFAVVEVSEFTHCISIIRHSEKV